MRSGLYRVPGKARCSERCNWQYTLLTTNRRELRLRSSEMKEDRIDSNLRMAARELVAVLYVTAKSIRGHLAHGTRAFI